MNLSVHIRQLLPQSLKNFLRQRTTPWRLSQLLSPHLPAMLCVDVGASYYPHVKWMMFLNSPKTQWIAVEPNEKNLGYVRKWSWRANITACTTGLSHSGGIQTLYVTNVDSGSSLLPPEIPESMRHRLTNPDYFFPVKERSIDTLSLSQAIKDVSSEAPIFVKLDTQGTELSILQGSVELFDARRIVGVEMESTLLAQPFMKGSGKFWQACEFFESKGFELLHIKPIHAATRPKHKAGQALGYLNECDSVFVVRADVASKLPVVHRAGLLAFYLSYYFYQEAQELLRRDAELGRSLQAAGCDVSALNSLLDSIV